MQFSTSDLPTGIDSVEKLAVWAITVLSSKQYAGLELSNNSGPVAPFYDRVARSPNGPNYAVPFFEFRGYIKLDNELYPSSPAYLSAEHFSDTDTVPARFSD